ncbi:hypothetical protein OH492_04425 [Vibrio chagasii]|nr:hypothetical protein [Vibrio chagasii]
MLCLHSQIEWHRRSANSNAFLLANGHGAEVHDDPLAGNEYIVVIDFDCVVLGVLVGSS